MNIHLNNLFGRVILLAMMALTVILSMACIAQNKPDLSNMETLQTAPTPPSNAQGKCKSEEELKNSQLPPELKKSALNQAAYDHNLAAVKKLLKQNADPNEKDSFGNTPLLNALSFHILESHTMNPAEDPVIVRDRQKTLRFQPLIVKELLENKADVNLSNASGTTPLIEVVVWGNDSEYFLKLLGLLIEHQADVNLQDDRNFTALMYAVRDKKIKIVKFLLAHNAQTDLKNCTDETALAIAQTQKNDEIVRILQNVK